MTNGTPSLPTRMIGGCLAVTLVIACSSCSSGSSGKSSDCLPVSADMQAAIAQGEESGVGMTPVKAAAVKSPDFQNVYFIAMEFSATGVPNQTGVWASNSLEKGGGVIMAVDGFAQQFTMWPDADTTQASISAADASVEKAKDCV